MSRVAILLLCSIMIFLIIKKFSPRWPDLALSVNMVGCAGEIKASDKFANLPETDETFA